MAYNTLIDNLTNVRGVRYHAGYLYYSHGDGDSAIARMPADAVTQIDDGESVTFNVYAMKDINAAAGSEIRRVSASKVGGMGFGDKQTRFLALAGVTSLDEVSADSLLELDWASAEISVYDPNVFAEDKFFAVRIYAEDSILTPGTSIYHYAKLRIYTDDGVVKIDWVTYRFDIEPSNISAPLGDIRDLLVSDLGERIYVSMVYQGYPLVGFVMRQGDPDAYKPEYSLDVVPVSNELSNPQQLAADDQNKLFVADQDKIWWIDPEIKQFQIVGGLTNAVGVLFRQVDNMRTLYVADDTGVYVIDVSNFDFQNEAENPPAVIGLPASPEFAFEEGVVPGFLSWADEARTAIYVADRNNMVIKRLDLATGEFSDEISTADGVPWGVALVNDNRVYVGCETRIDLYERILAVQDGAHALGVGLIPFQYITEAGLADTSPAPGYYFSQYSGLPFGGTLSLMVNHDLCWEDGIRSFTVSLENLDQAKSRQVSESFVDLKWGEDNGKLGFWPVTTAGAKYSIRDPEELWYNAHLGAKVTTTLTDNGLNRLVFRFFDANNQEVDSFDQIILIDNTRYYTKLYLPRIGSNDQPPADTYPALECGCLTYSNKDQLVEFDFAAWFPQEVGQYTFNVYRGGWLANLRQSGPVTAYQEVHTKGVTAAANPIRVGHIIGDCDIANVTLQITAPSRVIDGFGWVYLGSTSTVSFTLLQGTLTHTPWVGEP